MDKGKVYTPSHSIIDGEILIKGKTLGRWQTKRFLIDEEQRVFALRSSNPKKKLKVYYLSTYKLSQMEKKKERVQFDLISSEGGKNLSLGYESDQQAQELYMKLKSLCGKQPMAIRQSLPVNMLQGSQYNNTQAQPNQQIVQSQEFNEKQQNAQSPQQQRISDKIVEQPLLTQLDNQKKQEIQDPSKISEDADNMKLNQYLKQIQDLYNAQIENQQNYDEQQLNGIFNQISQLFVKFQKVQITQPQTQQQSPLKINQQQQVASEIILNKEVQEIQQVQEDQDEFFDCENEDQIDAMNDKLFIGNEQNNQDLETQEFTIKQRQTISQHYASHDTDQNLANWVDKRKNAYLSGLYSWQAASMLHKTDPIPLDLNNRIIVSEIEGGNYIMRKDFVREEKNGGLKCINEEKLAAQKSVIKFLLTKIGSSLLLGKSLTSISMPVSIFEPRSNTERVCNSMGFAPIYLEKAGQSNDIYERMKQCTQFSFGFILTYLSMEKPFNPILGETFQGFIDGCPIYCEQISHHPPICVTQFYGRNYKIDARLELVANFHSNSVTGRNIGFVKVIFENPHQEIKVMMAPGSLNGTTYGDKVMNYLEKQLLIDTQNKIITECAFNPEKKYCQYFGVEYVNQADYIAGGICDVTDQAINRFNKEGYRKYKGLDLKNDVKQIRHRIKGNWTLEVKIDEDRLISIFKDFPVKMQPAQYPIPSDANFRMDVLEWKLRKFDESQQWKEKLEILQRNDRKLREGQKKKKH